MALLHVTFYSGTLEREVQMDVVLPETAKGLIGMVGVAGRQCKTLYLLHGMSDDQTIWQRRTAIERYAAAYGLAVVMPCTDLGWYTDMYRGDRYFTFITRELPAVCRDLFPMMSDRREDTYAAGLSMGGYGALKCALRAGDVFSRGASLSGAVDVRLRAGDGYWEDVFGPKEQVAGSFNDLFAAAEELPPDQRPSLFMWCGTEDSLLPSNRALRDHLLKLGYDLSYSESEGNHSWQWWDLHIQDVLRWLFPETEVK